MLRLAFRWRSATCEKTRRAVVVDRERASATRRPPATGAAVTAGVLSSRRLASRARGVKSCVCRRSISSRLARRATYAAKIAHCSSLTTLSSGLRAQRSDSGRADESSGRLWYECGTSGLLAPSDELQRPRGGCITEHSSSPTRERGIRHKRDLDFRSSVSYYSHALGKTSISESCSKRSDTAAPSQHTRRLQGSNQERCVASSRSQPSQAPRPT